MLDKIIHKHIDRIDEIQEAIDKEIERVYKGLNIDEIIKGPTTAIYEAMTIIKTIIIERYAKEAINSGLELAEVIKRLMAQDKEIKVSKSKDPKLNEDINDNG